MKTQSVIKPHPKQEQKQLKDVADLPAGTIYLVGDREADAIRGRLILKVSGPEMQPSFHYLDTGEFQFVSNDILVTPINSFELTYRL